MNTFDCSSLTRGLDEKKKNIMNLFAACTKTDVTLNNYITRSKNLESIQFMWQLSMHYTLKSLLHCKFAILVQLPQEHQIFVGECEGI